MTTKADSAWKAHLELVEVSEGVLGVAYALGTYRFLLSDGRTVDVTNCIQDDSYLRSAVLDYTKADKIEGVARL